jgi:hypothetical protein
MVAERLRPGAGPARSVKHADDLGTDVVATAFAARGLAVA